MSIEEWVSLEVLEPQGCARPYGARMQEMLASWQVGVVGGIVAALSILLVLLLASLLNHGREEQ